MEKSYQQVANLESPRKAETWDQGRSWTNGGTTGVKDAPADPAARGGAPSLAGHPQGAPQVGWRPLKGRRTTRPEMPVNGHFLGSTLSCYSLD